MLIHLSLKTIDLFLEGHSRFFSEEMGQKHRVDRVLYIKLSFQSSELGPPHTQVSVSPPLVRGRGGVGEDNSNDGTDTVIL